MSSTSVTLERYAEIRAEMETGRLRDEVLKRAGIELDEWPTVQRAWLEKMGKELERGKFELTNRYTQVFLDRQHALKVEDRVDAAKGMQAPAPVAAIQLPVAESAQAAPALPMALPEPFVIPIQTIQHPLVTTLDIGDMLGAQSNQREVLPFDPSATPALPVVKESESRTAPKKRDAEGGTLDMEELQAAAASKAVSLPFGGQTSASPAKPLSQTMDIGEFLASGALPATALPFDPSAPPSPELSVPKEKSAPTPPTTAAQIGATLDIFEILHGGNSTAGVTPFEKPTPDKPTSVSSQLATTSPFPIPAVVPATPALTLERYASLCVEYAAAPARAPEIAQRYGLTREQWGSVDAYWRGKMASEPAVRVAWEKACVTYREWISRR